MLFIILSIIFSVAVSIVLKLTSRHLELSLKQMIAFNYITAIFFCCILLGPSIPKNLNSLPWPLFISLGILLPSVFIIMGYAVKNIGIIKTDIAQRLALFIPILASFILFNETPTTLKMIGISCAFVAILLLFSGKRESNNTKQSNRLLMNSCYFLSVFIGFGVIDILLKQVAISGIPVGLTLLLTFSLATIILFSFILIQKERITLKNALLGSLIGLFNFSNIYFYLRSHQVFSENPTLVFTTMNVGVIIVGTLIGRFIFKEPLNYKNWLGIVLAIFAIVFLFNGQKLIP